MEETRSGTLDLPVLRLLYDIDSFVFQRLYSLPSSLFFSKDCCSARWALLAS